MVSFFLARETKWPEEKYFSTTHIIMFLLISLIFIFLCLYAFFWSYCLYHLMRNTVNNIYIDNRINYLNWGVSMAVFPFRKTHFWNFMLTLFMASLFCFRNNNTQNIFLQNNEMYNKITSFLKKKTTYQSISNYR